MTNSSNIKVDFTHWLIRFVAYIIDSIILSVVIVIIGLFALVPKKKGSLRVIFPLELGLNPSGSYFFNVKVGFSFVFIKDLLNSLSESYRKFFGISRF